MIKNKERQMERDLDQNSLLRCPNPTHSLAVNFDVLPASPSVDEEVLFHLETVGAREAGGTGAGVVGVVTFGGGGLGGCVGRGVAARNELRVLRIT